MIRYLVILGTLFFAHLTHAETAPTAASSLEMQKVVSAMISEDLVNQQLAQHVKSKIIQEMKIDFDPKSDNIYLRGLLRVPTEELRAVNLDPSMADYRFQVSIKLSVTKQGYLIVEFPLRETFFYPANSKDTEDDRILVPVQMLSVAIASVRGYLAALSGDFSGFDRRVEKLQIEKKMLEKNLAHEKNADVKEDLKNQLHAVKLQLEAVPVERKQLETASQHFSHLLAFTGEKELNLNQELGAKKNALIFKIKLSQLTPFLQDVELGGIHVHHMEKDGKKENYLVIDVNSAVVGGHQPEPEMHMGSKKKLAHPPLLALRLNQALLESETVVNQESKATDGGKKIRDLKIQMTADGIKVTGKYHALLMNISFETMIDMVSTGPDVFEARVREIEVGGMDMEFMSQYVLETLQHKLEKTLNGICVFEYKGTQADHSRALQVTVETAKLVPAFADLHLMDVEVQPNELLLKVGAP